MQTSKYFANSDFGLYSGGYQDIIMDRFQPFVLTAGAVAAANTVLAAITTERNYVHTLLADGIVEVAPTIIAAAADDGIKLRFITKELQDCYDANLRFGAGLANDPTLEWAAVPGPNALQSVPQGVSFEQAELFRWFVGPNLTPLVTTQVQQSTVSANRAAVQAALNALWQVVDTL